MTAAVPIMDTTNETVREMVRGWCLDNPGLTLADIKKELELRKYSLPDDEITFILRQAQDQINRAGHAAPGGAFIRRKSDGTVVPIAGTKVLIKSPEPVQVIQPAALPPAPIPQARDRHHRKYSAPVKERWADQHAKTHPSISVARLRKAIRHKFGETLSSTRINEIVKRHKGLEIRTADSTSTAFAYGQLVDCMKKLRVYKAELIGDHAVLYPY